MCLCVCMNFTTYVMHYWGLNMTESRGHVGTQLYTSRCVRENTTLRNQTDMRELNLTQLSELVEIKLPTSKQPFGGTFDTIK
jgi:hypothetical protein